MASACGVTYQAAKKWVDTERLPRTEWTGETTHAEKIAALLAANNIAITRDELMARQKVGADDTAPAKSSVVEKIKAMQRNFGCLPDGSPDPLKNQPAKVGAGDTAPDTTREAV